MGSKAVDMDALKMEVVEGARSIFEKGLVETGEGNLSIRVPGKDEMLITPTYNKYNAMTLNDVVHLAFDGSQLNRGRRPSTEYRLHSAVYRRRPKAFCVVHTHSPYATMLSVARKGIPIMLEEMVIFLGGPVRVSEFGPAHTDDIGDRALKALGSNNAALLGNHGVLACGRTKEHAVKAAELVEKMARIYWGAYQIGRPMTIAQQACSRFREDFETNFGTE